MPDVPLLQVPVEVGLELCSIVRLDCQHSEGQSTNHFIYETDGRLLIADIVDLQHSDARAVIDRRELVQAFLGQSDSFEEFHVDLQTMARLRLLIAIPGTSCWLTFQIGWQAIHSIPAQYAMHRRTGHVYLVEAMQIALDSGRSKSIALTQVEYLRYDRSGGCPRAMKGCPGSIAQTRLTMALVPGFPFVEGLAR